MSLTSPIYRLKAVAGDATPTDKAGSAGALAGTATATLVDRGSGDVAWQFATGQASVAIPTKTPNVGVSGSGVTIARTFNIVNYGTLDFDLLSGIVAALFTPTQTDPNVAGSGIYLQKQGSGTIDSYVVAGSASGHTGAQSLAAGSTISAQITIVTRLSMNNAGGYAILDNWISTTGRSGTTPDKTSGPVGFASNPTFNYFEVDSSNGVVLQFKDVAIWWEELTNAQCAAVADNLRGTIDVVATVPDAPTIGAATVTGATSVSVAGTASSNNGGAAIDLYRATSTPGGITATSATLPVPVPGLTTGTAYTFRLEAHNSVGWSSQSAASNSVAPTASNVAPAFGGTYPNVSGTIGTALSAPAANTYFTDTDTLTYSASPAGTAWPAGVTCNAATGQPTGTPTGSAATTTGCKIRASDGSLTADSNAFNFVIAAAPTIGTLTNPPLVNNTVNPTTGAETANALRVSEAGWNVWATTTAGAPVGTVKTNQTTSSLGVLVCTDAAYVAGTLYLIHFYNPTIGFGGWNKVTAT